MRRVVQAAFNRPLLVAIGLAAANALIWFLGPLMTIGPVRPLESEWSRWLVITVWAVLAVAYAASSSARQAQRNRRLLDGLVADKAPAKPGAAPGARDLAAIGKHFEDAISVLKRSRIGGRRRLLDALAGRPFVYQLPWYVIIGAPGAGKTTALANSGLEFPLAAQLGKRGVRGVGGTRNCDWWFTADAVLIDTAGRLTTQDSDHAADQAAWFGFLDLLRRYRPRRPINGVLLTISVGDLLSANRDEQRAHARRLRERLEELQTRLGAGIPVYVLVTKLDLLAGFIEFFADFDKDERAQVWGVTFPYDPGATAGDPLARAPSELVALEKRLDERLLERLHGEADRERRAAIYAFPQQWRVLRETLAEFLQMTFAEVPAQPRPLVRGIYFTSATQEGTPIDRAIGGLARSLGLSSRIVPAARPSGKSFFVTRLLREVVFAEAGLAGSNLRWKKQRALLQWSAVAATVAVAGVGLAVLWRAYVSNSVYLADVDTLLTDIERHVATARSSEPTELLPLLPVLDSVSSLGQSQHGSSRQDGRSGRWFFSLDQQPRINAASQDAYLRLLQDALLPRIAVRLEARLRAGAKEHVETIYEALKAYLMLFRGQNFDRQSLSSYLRSDWDLTLPATVSAEASAGLRRHFERLVASGEVGAPMLADQQLIDHARSLVAGVPLVQRAYIRLQNLDPRSLPVPAAQDFTVESAAGSAARQLFARQSGRPISQGVPAFYTRAVHGQLRRLSEAALQQLGAESNWVLGTAAAPLDAASIDRLHAEIEQRYLAEYAGHWSEFIRDLRFASAADLAQNAQLTQILARTDSPLKALLTAAARELALDRLPREGDRRSRAIAEQEPKSFAQLAALQQLVTDKDSTLDEAMDLVGKLSSYLTAVDDALKRKSTLPASTVTRELSALASRLPEPLQTMLQQLAQQSTGQIFAARRTTLESQLAVEVGGPCSRAIQGRYPVARSGREDISRADFASTFAGGGLIDGFFQRQLAPYVDVSTRGWTLPKADGSAESAETLQPFQRAQLIRNAMFSDGGRTLGVRLEFRLLELDAGLSSFEIEVDGQMMRFTRDTRGALSVRWPSAEANVQRVRLGIATAATRSGTQHAFDGPWALLRLFERVRIEASPSPDRILAVFDVEGQRARFEIRSATGVNPLRLPALEQFQCPQKL
jgi:type VI secretion system protein ImpL